MNKLKRALSSLLAFTMVLSMITVMNVSCVFANYSDTGSLITWDFSEYEETVVLQDTTYIQEYEGLTLVGYQGGTDSKDYVSASDGYHINGSSYSSGMRRYIEYTPDYDGTLTVTFSANGSGSRSILIGTAFSDVNLDSSNVLNYTTTEDTDEHTISANLTAGTTYYVYFTSGYAVTKLEYVYTTTEVFDYYYAYFTEAQASEWEAFSITDTDGKVLDTDTVVYEGVDTDGDNEADVYPTNGYKYIVAYIVTGADGASDIQDKFKVVEATE